MSVLLALASAGGFGAGDFMGGLATRRSTSAVPVVAVSHVVGLVVAAGLVTLFPADVTTGGLVGGAIGGFFGAVGIALLYRGLAVGRMAVVAPIGAVVAAALPLGWALVDGERPGSLALAGAAVGLVAIPLVAAAGASHGRDGGRLGILEAIGAGIGFALFFIALASTEAETGAHPLLAARVISVPMFAALALMRRESLRLAAPAMRPTLGAGALDMVANGLFLAATRLGFLAIVAVLSSLYPVVTVVLARAVLGERVGRLQGGGLGLAAVGVAMMATG